jgi:hypothetical protein
MKLKSTFIALTTASALISSASAITIDIVGSTAGRAAVIAQILALVNETSTATSGSALASSNQAIVHGTYGSVPIIVRVTFTGSAAGVNQVANNATVQVPFFRETVGLVGNTTNVPFSGANIVNSAAEIGFSDVFQSTTQFSTPLLAVEDEVSIIPFQFFRHSDGNTAVTNVTIQMARALYGFNGQVDLFTVTGNIADQGKVVYVTGRDELSGSRLTALSEINTSFTSIVQYQPTTSAANGTGSVTNLGVPSSAGFPSNSFVANVLNSTFGDGTPGNVSTIVSYLGASDWPAQVPGNAVALTYNGVPYSIENIRNGRYTFWGYLHQFHNGVTGSTLSFYNDLRDAMAANPGSGQLPITDLRVFRDGDGLPVLQLLE